MSLQQVIEDVENERAHQEDRWGVVNDDRNTLHNWCTYIAGYTCMAENDAEFPRRRLIQVAALAVAAVESFDRNRGFPVPVLESI